MSQSIKRDNPERQALLSEFIIEIEGKPFVTFSGLLNLAHETGLFTLTTELIQTPSKENGHTAIVKATVVTITGTYSDFGDASPISVGDDKFIPHILRYASTRAKARVLRDALNIGYPALEELTPSETMKNGSGEKASQKPITERQLEALYQLAKRLELCDEEASSFPSLSCNDASVKIQELNQRLKVLHIEKSRNCSQQSTAQESIH